MLRKEGELMQVRTILEWVSDQFRQKTGLMAEKIFQIGFNQYMIEASNGKTYRFVG